MGAGIVIGGVRYDVALQIGAVTRGFKYIHKSYRRQPVNDWAPKYSTGDDQFAEGTWQPWALSDWSGGAGQEKYNNAAQNRFYRSSGMETRLPGRATLGGRWIESDAGKSATAKPVDFLGKLHVPCGTALRKYNAGWSTAYTAGASIVHAHVDGALLFLALGSGTDCVKWDGAAATVLAGVKANCFASYASKVWRALANHIYGSADAGVTWGTDVAIGDASSNITALLPYNQKLYIGKEDSLWTYDGTNTVKVLDYAQQAWSGNFKFMCEWGGSLYYNVLRRVIRFTPTTWTDVTPEITGDANKETYGYGVPVMFAAIPSILLVAFDGGENQYAQVLGYTGQGWHQVYGPRAGTMFAVGYSRAQDWIVVNDGSTRYQAQIAQADQAAADYEPSGWIESPWFDGGYPHVRKSGKAVFVLTRDCSSTETIAVDYRVQDGADWTPLGSTITSSSAPVSLSLDALNGAIEFFKLQYRARLARGADVSKRPVLVTAVLLYMNRPERVYSYSMRVQIKTQEDRDFIDACSDSTTPIVFTDPNGRSHLVFIVRADEVKTKEGEDRAEVSLVMIDAWNGVLVYKAPNLRITVTTTVTLQAHTSDRIGTGVIGMQQIGA